jgi:hypothetical protein
MEYLDKLYETDEEDEEHAAAVVASSVVSQEFRLMKRVGYGIGV